MTERTVVVDGPAHPDVVWARYADPSRWTTWAPHVTAVDATTETLEVGTRGTVTAVGVLPVAFVVTAVDPHARSWSWDAHLGPITLSLTHDVRPGRGGRGTLAGVTISGPGVVVLPYLPLMTWALRRLTS